MLLLASSLPVIIDVVTVLIIVGCVIFAGIRGFVRSFVSDFGAIISMILSMALCALMANFLESQFGLISALSKSISGALDGIFGKELMNTTLGEANSSGMTGILSSWLIQIVSGVKEQGKIPLDTTLNKVIAPVFGYYVACFISVIVLYALF